MAEWKLRESYSLSNMSKLFNIKSIVPCERRHKMYVVHGHKFSSLARIKGGN